MTAPVFAENPLTEFHRVLRANGFERDWKLRDYVQYSRKDDETGITVHVQLWFDQKHHRASCENRGHQWTTPTEFTTVKSMLKAIALEEVRTADEGQLFKMAMRRAAGAATHKGGAK